MYIPSSSFLLLLPPPCLLSLSVLLLSDLFSFVASLGYSLTPFSG